MNHAELVKRLVKPGLNIRQELTPEQCDLWHMATGISGEAGELLDAIKKHVIYGKPLDMDNVVEELGDLEFYMEGLRQRLEVGRDEVLDINIDKLSLRYGATAVGEDSLTYSDASAIQRADKV